MHDDWKYIVFGKDLTAVVFPAFVEHATVAKALELSLGKPISAGKVSVSTDPMNPVSCYGESFTLQLKSDPVRDTKLVTSLVRRDL